jgi:two-component system cell cycle sensor histidine kinase/response regulator CckA
VEVDVRKETILVVDDTEEVRKMVCQILAQHGYRVLEASDGTEALAVSEAHNHGIHLLLTDVLMPHMNGGELAERLSRINPRIRMIFMSGYTDDVRVQKTAQSATFLPKPFTSRTLTSKVREVLDAPCHE